MKAEVKALLDSVPASGLADQVLHPEHWTRDGHRITEVFEGTVYVAEPAGEVHHGQRTTAPHHMGYAASSLTFMLDKAIERLTFQE